MHLDGPQRHDIVNYRARGLQVRSRRGGRHALRVIGLGCISPGQTREEAQTSLSIPSNGSFSVALLSVRLKAGTQVGKRANNDAFLRLDDTPHPKLPCRTSPKMAGQQVVPKASSFRHSMQ